MQLSYQSITIPLIIMYSSTPRAEGSQRERPLQKSMFLPEHPSQTPFIQQRVQPLVQQPPYNPLKRSSMPVLQNINGTISPSYHYNQNHISFNPTNSNPIMNINSVYQSQQRAQSSHQFLAPNQLSIKHQSVTLPNEGQIRNFVKFDKQMGKDVQPNTNSFHETKDQISLTIQIAEQIKEKYLTIWLSPLKKEILDEINSLKSQFQEIKSEIKQQKDHHGTQTKQLRSQLTKIIQNNNFKIDKDTINNNIFEKEVNMLEERVFSLQNKFGQNFNQLLSQISNISARFQKQSKQKTIKSSLIKSSFPSFLLQYKQSFTIHKSNQLSPKAQDQDIVFTSRQYYIDKKGFLMDSQNRYLVDHQGIQIRLEQKHLRILQHHKILHK